PYGVRQGLIPLLIGAGLKVPRNPVHILEDGVYVKELRPDMIEKMSRHPKNFRVTVYELSPEFKKYLNEIIDMFSAAPSPKEGDPVRMAIAVMMGWLKNLPPICKAPGLISKDAESLISTLLNAKDPNLLLNEEFGKLTGTNTLSERVIWLRRAKLEIETVEENHKKLVKDFLVKAINADPELIRESYRKWKFQLPGIDDLSLLRRYDIDQVASGFLMRIGQNYDDEDLFIRSLAEIFSGQPLKFWDSNSLAQFEIRLGQTIRVIEETADQISMEMIDKGMPASGQQITSSWIERRLQRHIEQLVRHIGKSETKNYLDSLVEKLGGLN
ncbi:MAG: hypothetical protein N2578_07975, partial [Bdellovibrionaceae bacterium]|nr:hypothetical protein [Pseudobdellovibrionaceae bacterium]